MRKAYACVSRYGPFVIITEQSILEGKCRRARFETRPAILEVEGWQSEAQSMRFECLHLEGCDVQIVGAFADDFLDFYARLFFIAREDDQSFTREDRKLVANRRQIYNRQIQTIAVADIL